MYNINILHLIEGAKQAKGLTVIIDVFRAFSLECYLYDMDVRQIRPVGTIEEAFSLRQRIQNSILIGERHGIKCDGFDYGNPPSAILKKDIVGKTIIHTTSAGTQGIVNTAYASEIITGSLVNAKAVAILFVYFPVRRLAAELSRCEMTVKRSLNELENAGLIMRVRQRGFAELNRIYILIPKI